MQHSESSSEPDLSTSFILCEQDLRGDDIALDVEPAAARVRLTGGAGELAVTVVPAEADPATASLPGAAQAVLLRDLDATPGTPELALLLYLALQRARVWRRGAVVSAELALSRGPLHLSPLTAGDLRAAPLDLAMHRLYASCDDHGRALLVRRFVVEATACLTRHARVFAAGPWCLAVHQRRLAREQYIATLANTHQYVRYTPRLLARAISECDDEALRDHFTRHFRGEQKHDRLIEADLRYLGADVEFVAHAMAPCVPTLAFMSVQESMLAFRRDLTGFLAAPFVAEGLAAHVGPLVLDDLADNIRRWGYAEPAHATQFLASHARVDGGDDGHWSATLAVLARLLGDDTTQQRFLAALHLAADSFTASYHAHAEDLALFSPPTLFDP